MNSNCKNKTIVKQNHYLNMFQFYKQKYSNSTKTNIDLNFNFDKKRGTKRKFSEAFL
jgi:hypothetical protein